MTTPLDKKQLADKVSGDLDAAARAGLRVAKVCVRIVLEPKIEVMRRIVGAILNDER